jgi:membrane-associated two-gene conflict system component 1 (EACC1)
MAGDVTIGLVPNSARYDADDDRWRDQVADLVRELKVETGALTVAHTPVPGTKGSLDSLVLALGSAGVFTTALDVLRVWLARDKTRSVDLSYTDRDGKRQRLNVTATNSGADTLAPVIAAVADQIQAST